MIAWKIVKWTIAIDCKTKRLQVVLLPANLESEGGTSHEKDLATKMVSKWRPPKGSFFETNFLRIAGTLEAETSVRQKPKCLLAVGEDQKGKLFAVTFSLKIYQYKVDITAGHLLLACHRCLR